jgi:hypothetical protein
MAILAAASDPARGPNNTVLHFWEITGETAILATAQPFMATI